MIRFISYTILLHPFETILLLFLVASFILVAMAILSNAYKPTQGFKEEKKKEEEGVKKEEKEEEKEEEWEGEERGESRERGRRKRRRRNISPTKIITPPPKQNLDKMEIII